MTVEVMPERLAEAEMADLRSAVALLEGESFASRLANLLGRQAEALGRALPAPARALATRISTAALRIALKAAIATIDRRKPPSAMARRGHVAAAAASGAIGGAFGLMAAPIELPVSTTILLRSIAEIARDEGEDLSAPEAALACIEVFALGAQTSGEAGLESGYFAVRAALAEAVSESARFLARRGLAAHSAPALVRFISMIAARFGVVVSEKFAAQSVPVLGAVGGAAINAAFADHFQKLARGHFIIRRLERVHGQEQVRFEYERLRNAATATTTPDPLGPAGARGSTD